MFYKTMPVPFRILRRSKKKKDKVDEVIDASTLNILVSLVYHFYRWSFGVLLYEIFTIGKPITKVIVKLGPSTSRMAFKIEKKTI